MELLRNSNPNGLGKYAVINLQTNQVEWGLPDDPQYAQAVRELASRAGPNHPLCKIPD